MRKRGPPKDIYPVDWWKEAAKKRKASGRKKTASGDDTARQQQQEPVLYNNAMAARACGITVTAPPRAAAAADQFQFYDGNGYIVITPNTRPPDSAAWQNDPEFLAGFNEKGKSSCSPGTTVAWFRLTRLAARRWGTSAASSL